MEISTTNLPRIKSTAFLRIFNEDISSSMTIIERTQVAAGAVKTSGPFLNTRYRESVKDAACKVKTPLTKKHRFHFSSRPFNSNRGLFFAQVGLD